ncbi:MULTISPECIES: outer membrane lipoprotein carrier protein LolA [unclassified Pantoea]|uniref:outer membrane lipoprotein carrier protein LolA n=1 Tax=unclassified Pantoea TaxID=2630326 RepID=UPI001CD46068|nr:MULTISPECIES: outer membrane lipoprotein carrier protein LolA [unclassified Pantoea]MCA1175382.1 outer membrane lipoprotein carrier protein LolA [Pantoea sp. alder69]MCA1251359.1 outer membrane lipoprotein carrier protein LolA [Pantoea sp. alder70]MCA1263701.1 outer membrane lipoprotein carrier protein LolA [Pantoea sp. alder81]
MIRLFCLLLTLICASAHAVTLEQLQQRFASQQVIRANFEQVRTISGMSQPLVSRGQLLIAQQQGLWWHQATPFVMTLILDDKRMVQSMSGQPPQVITADSNPQMFQFNHLLRALFQADEKVLRENFELNFRDQGNDQWQLSLTPKAAPLNKIFNRIDLQGAAFLNRITLDDKQGDKTAITLSDTRTEPKQLTDEERARFAPAQ